MAKKNQTTRLTEQQKGLHGAVGIFGDEAKSHDFAIWHIAQIAKDQLDSEFPQLEFRFRSNITKEEINVALQKVDSELGRTLFVKNASIIPDGGKLRIADKCKPCKK